MIPNPLVRPMNRRRVLGAAMAACLVAVLAACPGEINGRVDRIGGPVSGGGGTGGGGPITGGGGGGTDSVTTRDPFVSVTAGEFFSCALTERGVAYCWGTNLHGQLGTGDTASRSLVPRRVVSTESFTRIASNGETTCGVTETGAGYCWGGNFWGTLGTGDTLDRRTPSRVLGTQTWLSISPGWDHTCGVDQNLTAWCWGTQHPNGELGDSTTIKRLEPVQVRTSFSFAEVQPGVEFTCGRRPDGVLMCWGANLGERRLGGYVFDSRVPQLVETNTSFTQLEVGRVFSCALESTEPRVQCWGEQYAIGSATGDGVRPQRITLNEDISTFSVGADAACALNSVGRAFCWGSNFNGIYGDGSTRSSDTPVAVSTNLRFLSIAVGEKHACAIATAASGGQTYCWGFDGGGALGHGSATGSIEFEPVRVR